MIRIKSSLTPRERIVFAVVWVALASLLAALRYSRHGLSTEVWVWGGVAIIPIVVGTIQFKQIDRLYRALAFITAPIGWVLGHVILGLIWWGLITPLGCLRRMTGYDPMRRSAGRGLATYWNDLPEDRPVRSYLRPF